jgi:mannose-1-phosphate guanylyltransferase/mannose-1-phosphate guanylyltransferase/phosphomannomutase
MVMAAGLGTRLRPLTYEVSKPMVPVVNRPMMEHVLRLLARHGFDEVIANLHWFPEPIRERFGDGSPLGLELSYSYEEELLGTAGGVRNVREFFGSEPFLVLAADPLTDVDLGSLVSAHRANDGIATLTVKRVANVQEYGVVVAGSDGRVQGFQEKPDPAEALSDRASCMIYVFEPEVFDYFPEEPVLDFALDVFPALLAHDVPFYVHETEAYWNDVGSLPEYLRGNLDALEGVVEAEPAGERVRGSDDEEAPAPQEGGWTLSGPALVGAGAEIGAGARLDGPLVVGPGARVGEDACVRQSVLLPGARVPADALVAGAIVGARRALVP